jgi:O-antigen ligase
MVAFLFYVLAFLLSLGQAGRISFFNQQINIYLFECIIIILIPILFFKIKDKSAILKFSMLFKSSLALIAVLLLSMFNDINHFSIFQNTVGFLYLSRFSMYIIFIFLLVANKDKNLETIVKKSIWIFILCTLLLSFSQFILYPNLRNLEYLGWDPHHHRLFGMFLDTTIMGIILSLSFFWVLTQPVKKYIQFLVLGLLLFLLFLTYSRISYMVFAITFFIFFIRKIEAKKIVLFFVGFAAILFFLPKPQGESVNLLRVFTVQARIENNIQAIDLFTKKPLLGYGYDRLRYIRATELESHSGGAFSSTYLTILVSTGIIGLLVFLLWLYQLSLLVTFEGKIILLIVTLASFFDNIILANFILILIPLLIHRREVNYRLNNSP